MKNKSRKKLPISRRKILPLLGSTLLLPFLGLSKNLSTNKYNSQNDDSEYQTLLRPDGTTVKVKKSVLNDAEIVKKNISNQSLLNWLGRKK